MIKHFTRKIFAIALIAALTVSLFAGCSVTTEVNNQNEGEPETLTLANEGVSEYVIVRGENASASEVTASTELQSYLKKISGAELEIVTDTTAPVEKEIVIGKTNREAEGEFDREELGDDGFIIKTSGEKLYLVGGEQRGTLYSVYEFLESYLGCRFYTSTFEKIPESATISVGTIAEDKQIPIFTVRNTFWSDYNNSDALCAKRKSNGRKWGVISEDLGGSAFWAGNACHTLGALSETSSDSEPCLNDENIYNTVLKNVRALLEANPGATFISISQNDSGGSGHGCQCEKCIKVFNETGSYAGMYLTFVNRIADAIKDDYPNVMIHTFAYRFTRQVPTGVVPADNVMVELCTIEGCFRHPLDECELASSGQSEDFADLVKSWAGICNKLAVWDYTTNFAHYCMTFPNFEVLRQNVKLFADNNVKYVFEQGAYQSTNGEFCELRAYLLSKLLWDPYMSEEE